MTVNSGKLGNADLGAAANTTVYTCGSGVGNTAVAATVTVSLCNRGAAPATVRIAVAAAAAPTAAEYIEYGVTLPAGGVLERTGIVLSAGERIVAYSDAATVSARVHGFEK